LHQVKAASADYRLEMTISIFQLFSNQLSLATIDKDNCYFKLFSKVTVGIFMIASFLSFATSYSDSALTCKARTDNNYFDTYCWSYGTVMPTSNYYFDGEEFGTENLCKGINDNREEFYNYSPHIWVTLMLLIQGALFMIPDIMWQGFEGGILDQFGTEKANFLSPKNKNCEVFDGLSKSKTKRYFFVFAFCECLNLGFAIINFIIMNHFLGGHFYNRMLSCKESIFPTQISCDVKSYAAQGGYWTENSLCFLGQNLVNQKIYLVIWAWFIVLFVASGCMIVFRILCIVLPLLRKMIVQSYTTGKGIEKIAYVRLDSSTYELGHIGHWFLLTQIGKNSSPYLFTNFLKELSMRNTVNVDRETLEFQEADESRKLC